MLVTVSEAYQILKRPLFGDPLHIAARELLELMLEVVERRQAAERAGAQATWSPVLEMEKQELADELEHAERVRQAALKRQA